MEDAELAALVFAAGRGDRNAATEFVRATRRDVRRFVASLAGLREFDDLVQDTYLRALRALPSFAGRSSVRTWLYAIARHTVADYARLHYRRPQTVVVPDWVAAAESADPHGQSRFEEHHALWDLLSTLSPQRRAAIVATQVLGLSYAEAAEVCGCPVGTIRSRVARARDDLIAAMAPKRAAG